MKQWRVMQRWATLTGPRIGIDLGSSHTAIVERGRGLVFRIPSLVSVEAIPGRAPRCVATGRRARRMQGRAPARVTTVAPVDAGVVSDLDHAEAMLAAMFRQERVGRAGLPLGTAVIAAPSDLSRVEARALRQTVLVATGRRRVQVVPKSMAAALGARLPVYAPRGTMIVDIGGGTTEIAVLSLGGIVLSGTMRTGGDTLDQSIAAHLRTAHNLVVGAATAERLKRSIGSVWPVGQVRGATAKGRDALTGLPSAVTLKSDELQRVLSDQLSALADGIHDVVERLPPEIAADVASDGVMLTGGGALLPGLCRELERRTRLSFHRAPEPTLSTALGLGRLLEEPGLITRLEGAG